MKTKHITNLTKRKIPTKSMGIGKVERKSILGFYGKEEDEYSYKNDVISKEINGQSVIYYSEKAVKHHAKVNPIAWEHSKKHYLKITPNWFISTEYIRPEAWTKLAGLKVFDYAVPHEWQQQHKEELAQRHGAVWWYDNDHRWGEPLFMDTIKKMAMANIKQHAPK